MKRVLVTGASGVIGLQVLKYLLSEGKYEITAIDLKNKRNIKVLKKFRKRINIIFGDISNRVLMEALVKDQDIIIHLATSVLPLGNMKKKIPEIVDYEASENIIRAICYYNPKCYLFYASTTSLYGRKDNVTVQDKINVLESDYYNYYKYKVEELIKEKLKNYTIYRFPLVLGNLRFDRFYWYGIPKQEISYITKEDAAYSLVRGINYLNILKQKTFNVVDEGTINYHELIKKMLRIYGFTWQYVLTKLFIDKDYSSPVVKDGQDLNDLINFQNDSLDLYFSRLKRRSKKRKVPQMMAKIFLKESK